MNDILKHRQAVNANIQRLFGEGIDCNADFQKAQDNEIEKARHGTYADTAENRRLNRVGQEYGHKAQEQEPSGKQSKGSGEANKYTYKQYTDYKAGGKRWGVFLDGQVVADYGSEEEAKSGAERRNKEIRDSSGGKDYSSHAQGASDEALKRAAADEKADKGVRDAAKKELEKRGGGNDDSGDGKEPKKSRQPMQRKMFSKKDVKEKGAESLKSAFKKLSEEYEKVYSEDGSMDTDAALAADDKFLKEVHKLIVNGELDKKTFFEVRESTPDWKYGFDGMPSYEEIRDDEEYMSDEEKNSPDFGVKQFETFIQKYLRGYDKVYENDEFNEDLALKLDSEFNESVYKLIKENKLDEKTFEKTKKKFKELEYGFDMPSFEDFKNENF